jgi:Uncharacterised nucleotidyltransferase
MDRVKINANCWPTGQQELLLRAALLKGQASIEAWERWKSSTDVEHLDVGSHRLLPHLYRNLQDQGVKDPLMATFKGVYRRTWYDNQLLFHQVSTLLLAFREAGIETMVLKGAALAILHYKDCGLRPMNDFDVMVPVEQISAAIELMRKLGWNPMPRSPEALTESYLSIVNSHGFVHNAGRECDLHWHLFPECCHPDADIDFWQRSIPLQIHGVSTRSLSPTDHLLHICVHGAEWNPIPPLRWATDAMMIMSTSPIDWDDLVARGLERRLTLPLRDTLNYLHGKLAAPVPSKTLRSLDEIPTSRLERAEYKYKTQNYEAKTLGYLPVLWFRYLRLEGTDRSRHKLLGFVKYLQRFWGAERIRQLPFYAMFMGGRKIRSMATSIVQSIKETVKAVIDAETNGREISK